MTFFRKIRKRKKCIKYHRWYSYKGFPFVVAEVINPEAELLKPRIEDLPSLKQMFNEDLGWFCLESPWYWFFGFKWPWGWNSFLFYDSLHLEHENQSEDERWQSMIDKAHYDIDSFWDKILLRNIWRKR